MNIYEKLSHIQQELKAPKNLYNSFGKYNYRNAEGIMEAVKPYLGRYNVSLVVEDDIVEVGGRIYVKAVARFIDCEPEVKNSDEDYYRAEVTASAYARESQDKKGMDDSQMTGTASSYARKYALNGLLLLDDTKDADTDEYHNQTTRSQQKPAKKEPASAPEPPITDEELIELCHKCGVDPAIYPIETFNDSRRKQMKEALLRAIKKKGQPDE